MSLKKLQGKRVLVTGAASGIGRATALAFAREGARLLLCDLDLARLEPVRDAVRALGAECGMHGVDVSNEAAMESLAAKVQAEGGALDVLVNNAGIALLGSFLGSPGEFWRRTLEVNVLGVVHGIRFFVPQMHAAGGERRVVNVASLAAIAPAPNMSCYAASKAAVVGLSETLDLELRLQHSKVGVTVVCPGIINTPITRAANNIAPGFDPALLVKLQAYYEATGASPDLVADSIVAALRSGRRMVLVGPYAKPLYHLRRLSRALMQRLVLADSRKMGYS